MSELKGWNEFKFKLMDHLTFCEYQGFDLKATTSLIEELIIIERNLQLEDFE